MSVLEIIFSLPGTLMMSVFPWIPQNNLDNMAIPVISRLFDINAYMRPLASLVTNSLVASGVTSRAEKPVPPENDVI